MKSDSLMMPAIIGFSLLAGCAAVVSGPELTLILLVFGLASVQVIAEPDHPISQWIMDLF